MSGGATVQMAVLCDVTANDIAHDFSDGGDAVVASLLDQVAMVHRDGFVVGLHLKAMAGCEEAVTFLSAVLAGAASALPVPTAQEAVT